MKKLLVPILLFILLIFVIVITKGGSTSEPTEQAPSTTTNTSKKTKKETIITSNDTIYFQSTASVTSAPNKTTSDSSYPSVGIYWVKEGLFNGQDTCTLYDANTLQVYANRYIASPRYGSAGSGTAYYTNTIIKQDKAIGLLDKLCFIP